MNNMETMNHTQQKEKRIRRHRKKGTLAADILAYVVLIFFALIVLLPFWMIVVIALAKNNYLATRSPFHWFPAFNEISFSAFGRVIFDTTYIVEATGWNMVLTGFVNTMIIAVPTLVVGMFSSSISAYAFAKMRFPGKNFVFTILLGSMMLPGIIMMIPSYVIYSSLGILGPSFSTKFIDGSLASYIPLVVPGMFGSAACVFFLRQFFSGIPTELVEAAKIDGMSHIDIYFRIMLPLALPALLAQAVLGFLGVYNDYLGPLIYITEEKRYTLQIALNMFATAANSDLPRVMAACLLAMLPAIVLYLVAQKYFIQGIALSGLKA